MTSAAVRPCNEGVETAALCANLAGLTAEIATSDPRLAAIASARFGRFTAPPPPDLVIRWRADGALPPGLDSPTAVHAELHDVVGTTRGFTVIGETFRSAVDFGHRTIEISGPPAAYPLDITLRYALPRLLRGALVFHAALLSDGQRSFLCTGPSGTGKSTLAELLPEFAVCDEMAVVAESGDAWTARSLPFWRARPASAPLAGMYLLAHGPLHSRRSIPPEQAVRRLASTASWPVTDAGEMAAALGRLTRLAAAVPTWELSFTPDRGVWSVIAGGGSS